MQDSGLKQQSLRFFMGTSQFSTRRFYKSKNKAEWRAEYAKHEHAVTFLLPNQSPNGGVRIKVEQTMDRTIGTG